MRGENKIYFHFLDIRTRNKPTKKWHGLYERSTLLPLWYMSYNPLIDDIPATTRLGEDVKQKKTSAKIRDMLLERRLVEKLENFNHLHGNNRSWKKEFLAHMANTIWPRWNYPFYSRGKFAVVVIRVISDCVEEGYIKEEEKSLFVTRKGRNFISFSGFWEEYLKRRKRFTDFWKAFLTGSLVTGAALFFLEKFYK